MSVEQSLRAGLARCAEPGPAPADAPLQRHRLALRHDPLLAACRRRARRQARWHDAMAAVAVAALSGLVFWLLPLPARVTAAAAAASPPASCQHLPDAVPFL